MKKFYLIRKDNGCKIEVFDTLEDAEQAFIDYERKDLLENRYVYDMYEIIERDI
jgi:hypothetical protein